MTVIGFDFGTGNSVLAVVRGVQTQVFQPTPGMHSISSDVLVNAAGDIDADPQHLLSPPPGFTRVTALKRHLLTLPPDAGAEREKWLGFAVARLRYLYEAFAATTHTPIYKAVLTCPANAGQAYRELLLEIGRRIGLPEVDIVDEPTAAAVHHGLAETASHDERWLVMDWGCGTCDVSAIERRKGEADLAVKKVRGDNALGGLDMDVLLRDQLAQRYGFAAESCPLWQVEALKIQLSAVETATAPLTLADGRALTITITRAELEAVIAPLLARATALVQTALQEARWGDVDHVIATGGPLFMPVVRQALAMALDYEEDGLHWRDPLTSVAQGAARLAELKQVGGLVVTNQIAQSIGVRLVQGERDDAYHLVIQRGETRPISRTVQLATSVDLQDVLVVEVREGENRSAEANTLLGRFNVIVRPEKKGVVKVKLGLQLSDAGAMEAWIEPLGDPNTVRSVQKMAGLQLLRGAAQVAQTELRLGDPVEEFRAAVGEYGVDPDTARQHYERLKIKYHPDRDPARREHWNARLLALDQALEEYRAEIERRIRATTLPDLPWDNPEALQTLVVDEMLAQRLTHCLAQGIGGAEKRPALVTLLKRYPDYRRVLAAYLFTMQRNAVLQDLLANDDRPHVGLVVLLQNLPDKPIRERHEVLKAAYRLPVERVRALLKDPALDVARLYIIVPQEAPPVDKPQFGGSYQSSPTKTFSKRPVQEAVVSIHSGDTVKNITLKYEGDWTWIYGDVQDLEGFLKRKNFTFSGKRNAWYATRRVEPSELS